MKNEDVWILTERINDANQFPEGMYERLNSLSEDDACDELNLFLDEREADGTPFGTWIWNMRVFDE